MSGHEPRSQKVRMTSNLACCITNVMCTRKAFQRYPYRRIYSHFPKTTPEVNLGHIARSRVLWNTTVIVDDVLSTISYDNIPFVIHISYILLLMHHIRLQIAVSPTLWPLWPVNYFEIQKLSSTRVYLISWRSLCQKIKNPKIGLFENFLILRFYQIFTRSKFDLRSKFLFFLHCSWYFLSIDVNFIWF